MANNWPLIIKLTRLRISFELSLISNNFFAETLSVLPLESRSSSTTSSLFLSTSPSDLNNPSSTTTTPTPDTINYEKTSSNPSDIDHTTKNPNSDDVSDKKTGMTMNSVQMKNQPVSVSIEKIFSEDDDDTLMTKSKPVHVTVNGGDKQIDENDDSNVPLVAMPKQQADVKGRALNLTDASFVNEMANRKAVEMINYVTTQSSVTAKGMEDLSDVSMDDDDEDSMHDMHMLNEDDKIDVNECINNGKRYKVR